MSFIKKIVLSILLSALSFSLYAQEAYYAGYKRIFVESERFGEFPVAVWFPTKQASETEYFGPFALKIALGAKLAKGRFPVVIISHGSGGSLLGHRDTAQFLAENGYIVAALLHPRNNSEDNSDSGKENRHQDIKIEGLADNRFSAGILLAPAGILFADKNKPASY